VRGSLHIKILIVDDEQDNTDLFKALLQKEGYVVSTLNDPRKVMETMKEHDFHLVILDMMMPEMSGTEVLESIRNFDDDIAVIVATGFPTVETAVASLKASASDYVRKPIEPATLLETVKRTLERKGLTRDAEAEMHKHIGQFIREGRTKHKLTLKQLARRTGLSVSLLSQIERAESAASIESLYRIASALKVKMAELFRDV
jgi:DNA-binding NtrC family response regulator